MTNSKEEKKESKESFIDYTENSSLHGISYAFERGVHSSSRIFWIVTFLSSFILALVMISQLYAGWKNSPILTTVEDPAYPITKVDFPAIIICGQGATDTTMEDVVSNQITKKLKQQGINGNYDGLSYQDLLQQIGMDILTNLYPGMENLDPMTMGSLFKSLSPYDYITSIELMKGVNEDHCESSGDGSGDGSGDKINSMEIINGGCGQDDVYDEVNEACYKLDVTMSYWEDVFDSCADNHLMTSFSIISDEQLGQVAEHIRKGK